MYSELQDQADVLWGVTVLSSGRDNLIVQKAMLGYISFDHDTSLFRCC